MQFKAPRDAFGEFLKEIGKDERIVVLTADLASSTRANLFQQLYPERFFNVGVAEQNMMGIAAGLSASGFIPIVTTFAIFASGKGWEQIRQSICYGGFNVKIVATHAGITVGEDGATHQGIEDIALMRAIPGMVVLVPADGVETISLLKKMIDYEGPVYMRLPRGESEIVYKDGVPDTDIGKSEVLMEGNDITIGACGVMVPYVIKAVQILKEKYGISAEVLNISSIKPIDKELIVKSLKKTGCMLTVEDHNIYGGMGSAVAEVVSQNFPVPLKIMGVPDDFGVSGKPSDLLKYFGLSETHIVEASLNLLKNCKNP
jgi:transketolase